MNPKTLCSALIVATLFVTSTAVSAGKNKPAGSSAKIVDSGTFGVYVRGQRIASEQFQIEQGTDYSVAKSEFRIENAGEKASQSAELQMEANGDLRRYSWRSDAPEKADELVEPSETFLVEHLTYDGNQKKQDIPFLLPHSTVILDDYFFSHREMLVWRYIASACVVAQGEKGCKLGKAQFGTLVPRQHISMSVTMEYAGKEKVSVKGVERELDRFNLHSEGEDWALYLAGPDENFKVLRMVIAGSQTEILRD